MEMLQGMPPIVGADARVLVVGSFPSELSLRAGEYYAHQRNAFWGIMEHLFGVARDMPYERRCRELTRWGVAVWDVLARCQRKGSLDENIRDAKVNDFAEFYRAHGEIGRVFCNGAASAMHYRTLVHRKEGVRRLPIMRLPSTSPANTRVPFAKKLAAWEAVRKAL